MSAELAGKCALLHAKMPTHAWVSRHTWAAGLFVGYSSEAWVISAPCAAYLGAGGLAAHGRGLYRRFAAFYPLYRCVRQYYSREPIVYRSAYQSQCTPFDYSHQSPCDARYLGVRGYDPRGPLERQPYCEQRAECRESECNQHVRGVLVSLRATK